MEEARQKDQRSAKKDLRDRYKPTTPLTGVRKTYSALSYAATCLAMFARLDPVGVVESVVMPFFQSDGEDDDGAAQASCRLHPALTHSALILPRSSSYQIP